MDENCKTKFKIPSGAREILDQSFDLNHVGNLLHVLREERKIETRIQKWILSERTRAFNEPLIH